VAGGLDVVVKFLADASSVKDETDKIEGTGAKIKDWAGKAALAIGGAFAVDKVVEFGKASIEAAADDARSQAILAQTLKNTTGATDAQVASVEKMIAKMSKSTAIADDELRPAMATLTRAVKDPSAAMELLSVATDVAAGTGKDLGSVTDAMAKAALGNTGALGRMGVATKDAAGHALSFNQITTNLATTFKGQAAVAADSAAGKMQNAKIQFGEFQEQIGGYLLPAVATMSTFFTNTLLPAISGVANFIATHKDAMIAAFVGFAVVVGGVVIPAFISWAAAAGAAAIATLVAAAPFIALGAVIAGVAYVIIVNWNTIRDVAMTVWNAILGAIRAVWNWISTNWPLLVAILTGPIGIAVYLIATYWENIKAGAAAVWGFIRRGWDDLVGFFTGLPGRIASIATHMWDGIGQAFRGVINWMIDLWNKLQFKLPSIHFGPINIDGPTIGVPNLPHLAAGGIVRRPTLALLGENGPEAVVPLGRGGAGIHIENVNLSDGADVDLLMRRLSFATTAGRL